MPADHRQPLPARARALIRPACRAHHRPRPCAGRPRLTTLLAAVTGLLALLPAGACAPAPTTHADGWIAAGYRGRTLSADLPARLDVPAVMAAAELELRARGYTITRSDISLDRGLIEARWAGARTFEKLVVTSRASHTATRVTLTAEPFGDEAASLSILDGMLQRLGQ